MSVAQVLIDSLLRAAELGLVAMGLTIVYSLVKFANIAHVEFATVGAFIALAFAGSSTPSIALAGAIAAVIIGLSAIVLHHAFFKRLLRSGSTIPMIGSLALAIVLRALVQLFWGTRPSSFERPLERAIEIGGAFITPLQVWLIAITVVTIATFMIILYRTKLGRTLRAVAANPELAAASGINVNMSIDLAWFFGAGFAALGGVLLALNTQASMQIGSNLLLPVFAVVILGGIGSPAGALFAALLIALAENTILQVDWGSLIGDSSFFVPLSYDVAIGFIVLVLTLLIRPQGLFGTAARDA
jgi:branched-subunit amino acid ABC-type transport system permease component